MADPKKQKQEQKLKELMHFAQSAASAGSDVLGSYTGVPLVGGEDETPVQDADDL